MLIHVCDRCGDKLDTAQLYHMRVQHAVGAGFNDTLQMELCGSCQRMWEMTIADFQQPPAHCRPK